MTTIFTLGLRDTVTYWPPGAVDRFGSTSLGGPITMRGRWEEVETKFRDQVTGDERVSSTSAQVELDCEVGGYLASGEHAETSPTDVPEAYEIKSVVRIPNLAQTAVGYRCLL